jgi:hypothetical protein
MLRTEMYSSHFDRSIDHFAGPATREYAYILLYEAVFALP